MGGHFICHLYIRVMKEQLRRYSFILMITLIGLPACAQGFSGDYNGGFIPDFQKLDRSVNFLAFGNWGRNGEMHQREVAAQMARAVMTVDAGFILALGNNFYPSGVNSTADPLWKYSFENIYDHFALQTDWYVALGNYDYKSHPEAEIAYSKLSRRWHMPSPYYAKKFAIDGDSTAEVLLVVIDTNPFVKAYYEDPGYAANVAVQDTSKQKEWLRKTLSDTSASIRWRIVAGHHPLYAAGQEEDNYTKDMQQALEPVFKQYHVDAYLCAHEHTLCISHPTDGVLQVISGTGAEARRALPLTDSLFAAFQPGFMAFSLSKDAMLIQAVDLTGKVLYKTTLKK